MKRGKQTSEWKLTVAVIVAQALAAVFDALPYEWAAGGSVASVAVYAIARGLAKQGGSEAFGDLAAAESTADPHPHA